MDYHRIYNQLVDRARDRVPDGYVERHHVVPRCMGGSDDNGNLVALTPEEHFLAHVLLVKMYPKERNLILAVQKMCRGPATRRKRKMYGWLRRKFALRMSEIQSGKGNSQYGSRWINDGNGTAKKHRGKLPEGWVEGRVLAKMSSRQMRRTQMQAVVPVRSVPRRNGPNKVTDNEMSEALNLFGGDVHLAHRYLGYKTKSPFGGCVGKRWRARLVEWQTRQA